MVGKLALAAPLAVALLLGPPQDRNGLLSVAKWYGTVTVTVKSKGAVRRPDQGGGHSLTEWTDEERTTIDATLSQRSDGSGQIIHPGMLPPPGEKGRWHSWEHSRNYKDEFACLMTGDCMSMNTSDTKGADNSTLQDIAKRNHRLGGVLLSGEMTLELDLKDNLYAFSVADPADTLRREEITTERRWESTHKLPNIAPIEEKGLGQGPETGYGRGRADSSPDFESNGRTLKVMRRKLGPALTLSGTLAVPFKPAVPGIGDDLKGEILVQWTFAATPPQKITLKIEAKGVGKSKWEDWRPLGGPDEATPGSHVRITASVVSDASPLADRVKWIALLLIKTSSEPGISINYPATPLNPPDPDLQFRSRDNPTLNVQKDRVDVWRPPSEELTADLACFDYGAWGTVIAEAELESGRHLLGHLKGNPGERELLIPHRPPKSLIATVWKSPGKDDADDDAEPRGDGHAGDGFTNYEEYRGFHVGGVWTEGDPNQKDFFVRNEAGALAEPGITMFADISGLRVHRLEAGELPKSRIINVNRTAGPHRVDQHGIRIKNDLSLGDYCQAISMYGGGQGLGTPKDVDYVGLGTVPTNPVDLRVRGGTVKSTYNAPAVAHELLHCCNVYHHGGEPATTSSGILWIQEPDGSITETGKKIRVLDKDGNDVTSKVTFDPGIPKNLKGVVWYIWEGVASGDIECVMRYDNGNSYTPQGAPNDRVYLLLNEEPRGGGLCKDWKATYSNVHRYGPCPHDRGNCAGQILVNDAVKTPDRITVSPR